MNIQPGLSGHWTDEQMIDHLYAGSQTAGSQDGDHLQHCGDCRNRLSAMQSNRRAIEEAADNEPGSQFLAAQRRRIYARLDEEQRKPRPAWARVRFASAAALLAVVCGGLFLYDQGGRLSPESQSHSAAISDSQLATEVSQMADASEPGPTEPLQALFAE